MNDKFETWAIVELMGHAKIAGLCTEQNIAGANMLRVDVPECGNQPAFSRFLGNSAIYAINPCTEETARLVASRLEARPLDYYDARFVMQKMRTAIASGGEEIEEEDQVPAGYEDDDPF